MPGGYWVEHPSAPGRYVEGMPEVSDILPSSKGLRNYQTITVWVQDPHPSNTVDKATAERIAKACGGTVRKEPQQPEASK